MDKAGPGEGRAVWGPFKYLCRWLWPLRRKREHLFVPGILMFSLFAVTQQSIIRVFPKKLLQGKKVMKMSVSE